MHVYIAIMITLLAFPARGMMSDGARSSGLGGAGTALNGFWSVLTNQAGLAGHRALTAGVSVEQRFLLLETGWAAVAIAWPIGRNAFGVSFQQFGNAVFRETKTGVALARSFGEKVSLGIQLDYLATSISGGYGRSAGITFEAGMQVSLTDRLLLAAHAFNPMAFRYKRNPGEAAEGSYTLGMLYRFSQQVRMILEAGKDLRYKPVIRCGLEVEFSQLAIVRIGYSSPPVPVHSSAYHQASVLSFGYGLKFKHIHLELGAWLHNVLGWSPAASMFYDIRKFDP